jgi:S-disulfanyl-L-cysteine oxidoreductase SoxD
MLKLNHKLIVSASVVTIAALLTAGCMDGTSPASANSVKKAEISGGVMYPIENGKTGPYAVNTQTLGMKLNHGRVPTANELKAWDKDVMPDGTGLPEGSGSVEEGEEIYEAKCVSCHGDFGSGGGGYPALSKGNGYELQKTLTNNRWRDPEADGPTRVFGSYWPKVSTMWWYIKDGMPHPKSKVLSDDEVYALTAYMLNINEIEIDGEEVDDEYVLDREKMLKVVMPNVDGFVPNIDGPGALEDVRKFYANPKNFGAQKVDPSKRCMKDCQEPSVKVTRIENGGISEFNPPMSVARDLPEAKKEALDVKSAYANNCAMCHDTGVAPAPGDKDSWASYVAKGMDGVYKNGINGTEGGMPPKGGSSLSDADFKTVVDYLISGK